MRAQAGAATLVLNPVLMVTRGYTAPEVAEASARVRALAEKSGNLAQVILQVVGACPAAYTSGDLSAASALADQVLDLAQREGGTTNLGLAHMHQAGTRS